MFNINKLKRCLIFCIVFFPINTFAVDFGSYSCGQIVQYERDNNATQMNFISMYFGGYIEGRNLYENTSKFYGADMPTLYLLLVKECREKPTAYSFMVMNSIYERGY